MDPPCCGCYIQIMRCAPGFLWERLDKLENGYNSVIILLYLLYTKIDFLSLWVKAPYVTVLKFEITKELLHRHLSWKEKGGPVIHWFLLSLRGNKTVKWRNSFFSLSPGKKWVDATYMLPNNFLYIIYINAVRSS